jgi:polyisoprenoid-binding protein YceI
MTNYLLPLSAATALLAGACFAAEPPAPAARVAAAPADTASLPHYRQSGGSLAFRFMQAGAESQGSFGQFSTELTWDEKNPARNTLDVTVQTASLTTQDKDRDDTLKGADLFGTQQYPTAQFTSRSITQGAGGKWSAAGKLTLRGVTRDLRIPLDVRKTADGIELSGETTLRRLDFGVGQGEWKSTEWVGDDVKLLYKVSLKRST